MVLPLLVNGLSTFWYQHSIHYHYGTLLVPGLMAATIWGMGHGSARLRRGLAVLPLVSALLTLWLWGPVPGSGEPGSHLVPPPAYTQAATEAMSLIPPEAAVAADYRLVPHLAHRAEIYEFPNPWAQRNWGNGWGNGLPLADRVPRVGYVIAIRDEEPRLLAILDDLVASDEFHAVYDRDGVVLLARGAREWQFWF